MKKIKNIIRSRHFWLYLVYCASAVLSITLPMILKFNVNYSIGCFAGVFSSLFYSLAEKELTKYNKGGVKIDTL